MNVKESKVLVATGSLLVGFLQAWDSGALQAGTFAQVLIVIGLVLGAGAMVSPGGYGVKVAMIATAALILVWARMVAAVSLNALHLGLFAPALYVLFISRIEHTLSKRSEA